MDGTLGPLFSLLERSSPAGPERGLRRRVLAGRWPQTFRSCVELGLLQPAGRESSVYCKMCSEAHFAPLQYNASDERYFYLCPENGEISVGSEEVELIKLHLPALLDEVSRALGLKPEGRRELVYGHFFELGVVEETAAVQPWTACAAIGLNRPGILREVLSALETRVSKAAGYVFSSSDLPLATPLPRRHQLMPLADAFRFGWAGLEFCVQPPTVAIGRRRTGEPPGPKSKRDALVEIANELKDEGATFEHYTDAARAALARWPTERLGDPPAEDTAAGYLSAAEKEDQWRRRPA